MGNVDLIIISQSEVVNYAEYSKFPLERISIYSDLIYPRMVHYKNAFHSHLDIINGFTSGVFWHDADFPQRRKLLSMWNLPGFVGIHLANFLQKFGINTYVINNFDAEWDIFQEIYEQSVPPPLVGISTTFHLNYSEIIRLTKWLKKVYPDISIVLGGAFVNGQMQNGDPTSLKKIMKKYGIDYVLHSFNSEVDLKNLLLHRKNGNPKLETVNNLIYYSTGKNTDHAFQVTRTSWNDPILEEAPPLWHCLDLAFLNSTMQMRTASGCPFACAFCSYPEIAHGFYPMSVKTVEDHIRSITHLSNISKLIFLDDTFNVPLSRFKQLCKMFAKYDFEWFSFLRVQFVDEETAKLMKESGCRGVYLGLESVNDQVLKNMNKRATRDQFIRGLEHLKSYDITSMAAFVLGFPGETEQSLKDNIDFIESQGIDFYTLKEFYYMENTPVHNKREVYGLTGMGNRWSHNTMDSQTASQYKISLFKQIKHSTFIDPDMSLWYLAYLYDQGFSMEEVATLQRDINDVMLSQIDGKFDDNHPGFARLRQKLSRKVAHNESRDS